VNTYAATQAAVATSVALAKGTIKISAAKSKAKPGPEPKVNSSAAGARSLASGRFPCSSVGTGMARNVAVSAGLLGFVIVGPATTDPELEGEGMATLISVSVAVVAGTRNMADEELVVVGGGVIVDGMVLVDEVIELAGAVGPARDVAVVV
jgi:hypothetical protein